MSVNDKIQGFYTDGLEPIESLDEIHKGATVLLVEGNHYQATAEIKFRKTSETLHIWDGVFFSGEFIPATQSLEKNPMSTGPGYSVGQVVMDITEKDIDNVYLL
ncbi:MAG: hypothetical protein MAG795_00310 [Candidatus Woesearchaeota archaeon]|nr:hypothetical protein [Candidatus Woesearchaeota archaeon]